MIIVALSCQCVSYTKCMRNGSSNRNLMYYVITSTITLPFPEAHIQMVQSQVILQWGVAKSEQFVCISATQYRWCEMMMWKKYRVLVKIRSLQMGKYGKHEKEAKQEVNYERKRA